MRSKRVWIIVLMGLLVREAAAHEPSRYRLTALPGVGHAINSIGSVVGSFQGSDGISHAYLYKNGSLRLLPEFRGLESEALGINDRGEIVGSAKIITNGTTEFPYFGPGGTHLPVIWDAFGLHFFVLHHSTDFGAARAINNSRQIVGESYDTGISGFVAYQLFGTGGTELPTLPNALLGSAWAINENGVIAGNLFDKFNYQDPPHAVYWEAGIPHFLLGAPADVPSFAYSVNNAKAFAGEIAGHAAFWSSPSALPSISGVLQSAAYDVNDFGVAVGIGHGLAFLWLDGEPFRLQPLVVNADGWTLTRARAINNAGWIAGEGVYQGKPRGFLLTPLTVGARYVPPSGGR